jgi:alcohol dehydrogenase class IV
MRFELLSTPKIFFGADEFENIGTLIKVYGSKPIILGSESVLIKNQKIRDILDNAASKYGFDYSKFIIKGEPTIEIIDSAVEKAKDDKADIVVALGGGSAIDAGKAVAGLVTNYGSARDYMEVIGKGYSIKQNPLPVLAIPTTAGTGSEVTKNAVIFAKDESFKASIRSPLLIPRTAIVDPKLMLTVPPSITATCGMDALTQLIESYTSINSFPITDALALLGIKKVSESLLKVYKNGNLYDSRESMALAALLSGICLANAGLGAVHGFASPLGGLNIPHGVICARLLAPTIETNIMSLQERFKNHHILLKYSHLGELVSGKEFSKAEESYSALIDFLKNLTHALSIPSLSEFGITESDIPNIVEKTKKTSSMKYNPISLADSALINILKESL